MSTKNQKQYRDSIFQKVYELAHGRVVEPVTYDDLEQETGVEKAELLHVVNYFAQKGFLKFETGFIPEEAKASSVGERDKSIVRVESFIHLTAEGIDYYENDFSSQASPPSVSYHNTFNRENYGSFQQGGSDNNQDNNIVAGDSPQPARVLTAFPGLEEADIKVLKAVCEEAVRMGDRAHFIRTEHIAKYPALEGMSAEALEESLQALISQLFIEPVGRKVHDIQVFQVTVPGFDDYARAFIEEYGSIYRSVISRIVNDGDRNNKVIAAALNQPEMVINNILDVLQLKGELQQFKSFNSDAGYEIVTVSPLLKRKLKAL